MQRVCFTLRVRPERLEEYLQRHDPVWPDMLREIAASGRRNYSLFHAGDGQLIGYFETDDLEGSQRYLADSEVAARWEAEMIHFLDTGGARADQGFVAFPVIFNLEDQLAAVEENRAH